MSSATQTTQRAYSRRVRAKAVGAFVPKLTEKAFAKFGFSAVALISDWSRIAGPTLSAHTSPERLKWPRPVQKYADVEEGCEGRPGATLVLRVYPARALEVEYGAAQLIERINGYFGYRAVAKIKLIQAPLVS
ncbi:MAG: DciA family protein, partial [Pseudomonadota bacterium]